MYDLESRFFPCIRGFFPALCNLYCKIASPSLIDLAHTPIKETLEALGMKEESSWVRISAKTGTNCKRLENMIAKLTHGIEKPKEYKKW